MERSERPMNRNRRSRKRVCAFCVDKIAEIETELQYFLDCLPNIPADDLLPGGKENNQEIASWGEKPTFDFEPKNHVDLAENLGIIDYKIGRAHV